jgi:hypothetical protein
VPTPKGCHHHSASSRQHHHARGVLGTGDSVLGASD